MLKKLTTETFDNEIKGKTVLVDFWATWCQPCKRLMPILDEVSEETSLPMYKVEIEESHQIADRFGIQSVPTLLILKDGEVVDTKLGFVNEPDTMKFLEKYL